MAHRLGCQRPCSFCLVCWKTHCWKPEPPCKVPGCPEPTMSGGRERERDERCLMNSQSFESFLTIQVSPADTQLLWREDKPPQGALSEFLMDDICELNTMAVLGFFTTIFWGNFLHSKSCTKYYGPLLTGSQLFRAYCMPGTMD